MNGTCAAHLTQAILHRKAYYWVIVASALAQTLTYIFRVAIIKSPASFGDYAAWFILILIAPLFTNAFTYMVMGRMIWNYVTDATLLSLIIQVYGAAAASGDTATPSQILDGLHVYMIGVGIQQFFIFVFLFFAFKFHQTLRGQSRRKTYTPRQAWSLLYALYAVILLITIRIIFRLVEYSQGLKSSIPNHEAFQYSLDSVPMLFALVILNIFHPGRIMAKISNDIPEPLSRA
ncbi:hypothetical protein EAF00_000765 [Botryotinia globosa]|nr:hypothetical protein EAF00_000765 [Botryotinia globosa]